MALFLALLLLFSPTGHSISSHEVTVVAPLGDGSPGGMPGGQLLGRGKGQLKPLPV
jgi:hypothetical protein